MNDKTITHEDLPLLSAMRSQVSYEGETTELLDRLIAAAEADKPALPEGWVLLKTADGDHRALWHAAGQLYVRDSAEFPYEYGRIDYVRDCLTPLRPSITEADLERATQAARKHQGTVVYGALARLILTAAGVEVQG